VRRVFQLRDRQPQFGELIPIDGSPHDWPRCTLIVFIDDATGRLTALRCRRRGPGPIWRRCRRMYWRQPQTKKGRGHPRPYCLIPPGTVSCCSCSPAAAAAA
jgi:hypothetical protein